MIKILIFLCFLLIVSFISLYFSIKKNLELIESLEAVVSQIEESLDILDYFYRRLDKKTKHELLLDEPIAKELIEDMKGAKDAILLVANKVSGYSGKNNENLQETIE